MTEGKGKEHVMVWEIGTMLINDFHRLTVMNDAIFQQGLSQVDAFVRFADLSALDEPRHELTGKARQKQRVVKMVHHSGNLLTLTLLVHEKRRQQGASAAIFLHLHVHLLNLY